jgi:lysophospholipase L1-like esterase
MKKFAALLFLSAFFSCNSISLAQNKTQNQGERWISTWTTAQQLMPASFPNARGGGPQKQAPSPAADPSASRGVITPYQQQRSVPISIEDQTIRMIAPVTLGGRTLRIELSNMANAEPLTIGSAHMAVHKDAGSIKPETDRILKFSGNESIVVPPGALVVSDPVDLSIAPFSDLAISLYLPKNTGSPTNHTMGLHTAYISKGNVTGSEAMPESAKTYSYLWLTGIDVLAPADSYAIVALGDSITDGFTTTVDGNSAWPTLLAKRLAANRTTKNVAVLNQGISGNQVVRDGAGVSALARFERDVLARPGVKWIILLEGINDINFRGRSAGPGALTSDELIAGYRQIIERAHMNGIKVVGATLTPEEGVPTASERGEEIRQTVNRWIRSKGNFDAIIDFDLVIRDRSHPARINPEFDPGDHIHPNDAGNKAMADAFDLAIFAR